MFNIQQWLKVNHSSLAMRRQGRLQSAILLALILTSSIVVAVTLTQELWVEGAANAVLVAGFIALLYANRRGWVRSVGFTIVLLCAAGITLGLNEQTLRSAAYLLVITPVLLASFLIVPWASFIVAIIIAAGVIAGFDTQIPYYVHLILIMNAGFAWLCARSLSQAIAETDQVVEQSHATNAQLQIQAEEQELLLGDLQQTLRDQELLFNTVRELTVPVIPIFQGVLILPLVGSMTTNRMNQITTDLLYAVRQRRARVVIIDLTGVALVDTTTAGHLLHTAQAAHLLGSQIVITGVRPEIAQIMMQLQIDLGNLATFRDLQGGIQAALDVIGARIVQEEIFDDA